MKKISLIVLVLLMVLAVSGCSSMPVVNCVSVVKVKVEVCPTE
ncbi:MAG: lipoprotein [Agitococcus sp.]|nr:lipoprotein [Agitococcus sp.]